MNSEDWTAREPKFDPTLGQTKKTTHNKSCFVYTKAVDEASDTVTVDSQFGLDKLFRTHVATKEKLIREGLIRLGWSPPVEQRMWFANFIVRLLRRF